MVQNKIKELSPNAYQSFFFQKSFLEALYSNTEEALIVEMRICCIL